MSLFTLWNDHFLGEMFGVGIPIVEKMIRPVLVYTFLLVLFRLFGKRELAQLNPFDIVVLVMLSNTVQNAIIGQDDSVTGGLIGAFALCGFNYLVVRVLYHYRRLDQAIEGKPVILIEHGKIHKQSLRAELITMSELISAARRQGFAHLDEIERCVLEPGGAIYMLPKEPDRSDRLHRELMARLDALDSRLDQLHRVMGTAGNGLGHGAAQPPELGRP